MKTENLHKIFVSQLANKNQFVIEYIDTLTNQRLIAFQSYRSLIAIYYHEGKKLSVNWQKWDYSKTTSKHLKMFINEYTSFRYDSKLQFLKEIQNNKNIKVFNE